MTKGRSLFDRLAAGTGGDRPRIEGDGPDIPFVVNSIDEEYAILHMLGRKVVRQSLREIDGRYFDVFEFESPRHDDFWFDITSFYGKSPF